MIQTIRYCECGCGLPTPLAKRTQTSRGVKKGQPVAFMPGHKRRHSMGNIEWRLKASEQRTRRKPVVSPYVPGLILKWSKLRNRWQTTRPGTASSAWHARLVWEYYYGPVPSGMHVHHKNGRADRIEDDAPENLMLLDRKWNSDVFPTISRTMNVPEVWITDAFLMADPGWSDDKILVFVVNELARRKGL